MATKKKIITEKELLSMSEDEYMNEDQLAFFRARLEAMEAQLRHNAGQTTETLRQTQLAPDPLDRATIEEEHALELRTRDRERKLLKPSSASTKESTAGALRRVNRSVSRAFSRVLPPRCRLKPSSAVN